MFVVSLYAMLFTTTYRYSCFSRYAFLLLLICFCSLLGRTPCFSQNLVPNPGFEQYTSCPDDLCQIHRATGWNAWGYSPDYFNSCAIWPIISVPYNTFGFQYPATGNGYAGFYAYDSLNVPACGLCREYIGTQLISPLVIGQSYYVKFKVSLADLSTYAVNNIGILLLTTSYAMDSSTACSNTNTSLSAGNYAQVYSSMVISDTTNWTAVSGSFIATSSYQYIIIGNHFDNLQTTHINVNNNSCCATYYYIDDIYIGTDSTESINEYDLQNKITVYPNPFSKSAIVKFSEDFLSFSEATVSIQNMIGNEIYNIPINSRTFSIERNNLPAGIYLLKFQIEEKILNQKIIIIN